MNIVQRTPIAHARALLRRPAGSVAALLALVSVGCQVHEVEEDPLPGVTIPDSFRTGDTVTEAEPLPMPDRWWETFEQDGLARAVEASFDGNLDLGRAWSRLDQASEFAAIAGADRLPTVDFDASAAFTRNQLRPGGTFDTKPVIVGVGLSWEVDLWRRLQNAEEAALLRTAASVADLEQTALLVSGSVVDTWFRIEEQRELLTVLERQVEVSRQLLELVELRFGQGQGNALQVYQQRQQLAGTESRVPPVRAALVTNTNQLAVLLGRAPQEGVPYEFTGVVPELPPAPITITPRELLDARPDLRAARRRLEAADREVAVAIADQLPRLRIGADANFNSDGFADLFQSSAASIVAGLAQPLFDGGRREAEVRRRQAIVAEALDEFGAVMLDAMREVEDALVRERESIEFVRRLRVELDFAQRALGQARLRFANGIGEYLDVIAAIQSVQELERGLVAVRRDLLTNRAALLRALGGGGFGDELRRPERLVERVPGESGAIASFEEGSSS